MNALTRLERFDDSIADFFRRFSAPATWPGNGSAGDIKIDVTENDKDYSVRAEMPGVKKEDIRVSVDGNFVSISAEVKKETEQKEDKTGRMLARELYYGSTSRGFSLPTEVDARSVTAKLEDGVLKLTLPKREGSGTRSIKVE
ncbi:Hsp20/alpha crystallin family protein [Aquabacterium sp.]|uniref:Hsp20/alpha crystallin family protein n=1 Tax=Aquabacterium sp. TaxID=1872578 RepID=UPI003783F67F